MTIKEKRAAHFQVETEVMDNDIRDGVSRITFRSPQIARIARPGQFVMVRVADAGSHDPLLRRPLSIHMVEGEEVSLLVKVVGRGTEWLARLGRGVGLDVVGPLGNGFVLSEVQTHCLVGGGIGIAPLAFLAATLHKERKGCRIIVLHGARNKKELQGTASFQPGSVSEIHQATDDGSAGYHGLVPELLGQMQWKKGEAALYCCGPWPMMQAVAAIARQRRTPCQVSLETTMACGVGACLGCTVQSDGLTPNQFIHVCKDGPVFDAEAIWPERI